MPVLRPMHARCARAWRTEITPCAMQQNDVAWEYDVQHLYGPVLY